MIKKIAKKKSVKVSAPKSSGVSKISKKSSGKKQLLTVSGDSCFWVNNGPILSNLRDLHNALQSMSDEQWKHHVRQDKNDFAEWVKVVLAEKTCSESLKKCKSKSDAAKVVSTVVKKY